MKQNRIGERYGKTGFYVLPSSVKTTSKNRGAHARSSDDHARVLRTDHRETADVLPPSSCEQAQLEAVGQGIVRLWSRLGVELSPERVERHAKMLNSWMVRR